MKTSASYRVTGYTTSHNERHRKTVTLTGRRRHRTLPFRLWTVWVDALHRCDREEPPGISKTGWRDKVEDERLFSSDQDDVTVRFYQRVSSWILLVFGSSQQQSPGQDVQSLSASFWSVVHLSFPQLELVKRRTAQEPDRTTGRVSGRDIDISFFLFWFIGRFFHALTSAASTCPAGCSGWAYRWLPTEHTPSVDTPPVTSAL